MMSDIAGARAYQAGRAKRIAGVTATREHAAGSGCGGRRPPCPPGSPAASPAPCRRHDPPPSPVPCRRSPPPARTTSPPTSPGAGCCSAAIPTTAATAPGPVPRDRREPRRERGRGARRRCWRTARTMPTAVPVGRLAALDRRYGPAQRRRPHRPSAVLQRARRRPCSCSSSTGDGRCSPAGRPASPPPRPSNRRAPLARRPARGRRHRARPAHGSVRPLRPAGLPRRGHPPARRAGPPRSHGSPAAARGAPCSTRATARPACEFGRVARRDLAAIGIDLDVRAFRSGRCSSGSTRRASRGTSAYVGWHPAYADGGGLPQQLLRAVRDRLAPRGSVPDPALDRRIRVATRLPDAARARAIARARRRPVPLRRGHPVRHRSDHRPVRRPDRLPGPPADLRHLARRALRPALTAVRRYFAREASQAPHFSLFSKLCPVSPCSLSKRMVASSRGA